MMASKADLQVKICDFGLATLHQNSDFLTSQCGTDDYGNNSVI
jgi:serine/threonine protein kinase